MATAIAIRFPLGRYHATPWERAVNEGEVEWPPSMWRIARALLATWHHRWPELDEDRLDAILTALTSSPPAYRTPPTSRGHTRHYMPDLNHTAGAPSTDLVLDPYAWVATEEPLLVRWEVDLSEDERSDLAGLCELVPYLGRSESMVEMSLMETADEVDDTWWRPGGGNGPGIRLLQPEPGITRGELEVSTPELRRRRLPVPPRTALLSYDRAPARAPQRPSPPEPQIEAIRWRLLTKAPFRIEDGILATEHLRTLKLRLVSPNQDALPASLRGKMDGRQIEDGHHHAHWLWLGDDRGRVTDLVLWMPDGDLSSTAAAAMIGRSDYRGWERWNPKGFTEGSVQVVALGPVRDVVPELLGPASGWTTRTPYLPVRRQKRNQADEEWVRRDLLKECSYRGLPAPVEVTVHEDRRAEAVRYRRYRWSESMGDRRRAVWVTLRFDEPVGATGPICLGRLSHFGFGLFTPDRPAGLPAPSR